MPILPQIRIIAWPVDAGNDTSVSVIREYRFASLTARIFAHCEQSVAHSSEVERLPHRLWFLAIMPVYSCHSIDGSG